MPRTREFDTDQVLDDAMQAFWTRGYEATSVADLLEATGLQKGSLYKAFGDKHALFLITLQRYLDRMYDEFKRLFEQMPPAEALRAWVFGAQEYGRESPLRRGCMALNSVVELAPHDPEVKAVLNRHFRRVERLITQAVTAGQKEGAFRTDVPAVKLVRFLMVWTAGAVTTSRAKFPGLDDETMAELAYSILE